MGSGLSRRASARPRYDAEELMKNAARHASDLSTQKGEIPLEGTLSNPESPRSPKAPGNALQEYDAQGRRIHTANRETGQNSEESPDPKEANDQVRSLQENLLDTPTSPERAARDARRCARPERFEVDQDGEVIVVQHVRLESRLNQ